MAKKRFLAILLSVLLLIQAMPMNALAAGVVRSVNIIEGAQYSEVTFMVGDTEYAKQVVENGASPIIPEEPVEEGSIFLGWFDGETEITAASAITSNVTAEAKFQPVGVYTVTVHYQNEAGVTVAPTVVRTYSTLDEEDEIVSPVSVKQEIEDGFELLYPEQASIKVVPSDLEADVEYTVVFTRPDATYTVEHYANPLTEGGKPTLVATEVLDGRAGAKVLPQPKKDGVFEYLTFASTSEIEVLADNSAVGKVYYNRDVVILKYDAQGGSYVAPITAKYGETVTAYTVSGSTYNPAPARAGYVFAGWYLDAACTQAAPASMTVNGDTTVYAKWTPGKASYTIVYKAQDSKKLSNYNYITSVVVNNATVGSKVSAAAKSGGFTSAQLANSAYYHFNADISSKNVEVKPDGSTVIEALYDLNVYTLRFNINKNNATLKIGGGTYANNSSNNTYEYSFTARLGEDISSKWPTKGDFTMSGNTTNNFYGWDPTFADSQYASKRLYLTTDMIRSTNTSTTSDYDGVWSSGSNYYLHYMLQNADDNNYTDSPTYSQEAISNGLDYSQKDIDGFDKNASLNSKKTVSGVVHQYFYYTRKTFNIEYYSGTTKLDTITGIRFEKNIDSSTYNWTPTADEAKVDKDYTFAGWYNNPQCVGDKYAFDKMPANNVVLYAKFEAPARVVTLNYNNNGHTPNGTINTKKNQTIAAELAALDEPSYTGHTFAGWYTEDGKPFDHSQPITNNITLVAHWNELPMSYTIKYMLKGTETELADSKTVSNEVFMDGETYTANYENIQGYRVDAFEKTITLVKGEENVVIFWYTEIAPVNYTVHYYLSGTTTKVADSKTVQASAEVERVVEKAVAVEGYFAEQDVQTLTLSAEAEKNVIIFYYNPYKTATVEIQHLFQQVAGSEAESNYAQNTDLAETENVVLKVGNSVSAKDHIKTVYGYTYFKSAPAHVVVEIDDSGKTLTMKIYYNISEFTVSYEFTGAVPADVTVPADSKVIAGTANVAVAAEPSKAGYTFHGWETDDVTVTDGKFTMPVGDVHFVGNWTKNGAMTVALVGETLTYDGDEHQLANVKVTIDDDAPVTMTVAQFNETYGQSVAVNGKGTNVGTYPSTLQGGAAIINVNGQNYDVVYAGADLVITPCPVTFTGESKTVVYTASEQEITGISDDLADAFSYTGLTYSAKGTAAGNYPGAFSGEVVILKGEEDVTANFTITKVPGELVITKAAELTITVTGESKTVVYNAAEQQVTGWTDNAPDDVTVTLINEGADVAKGTNAGTYYMGLTAEDFTAVSPNYETINIEVVDGYLTITPVTDELVVTVTGNNASKVYNGETQSVEGFTHDAPATVEVALAEGASAIASGKDVGTYPMNLEAADFVASSINYTNITVKVVDGWLEITPVTDEVVVTIEGNTASKVYNGAEQSVEGYKTISISNALYTEADYSLAENVEAKAAGIDVGEYPMGLTEASFVNNSKNFSNVKFVVTDGGLEITPIETVITITAATDSKTYDGTALTNDGYTFTENVLVEGDELTAVVEGTITDAGSVANVVTSYKVMRGEVDVTDNYTFADSVNGTLTISKRAVTLTSATDSKVYDGTALTNSTVTVTGDGFVEGEGASYDVTGTQTEEGSSANAFTYTLNEGTKAENYDITKIEGTLTVTPVTDKVTVTITEHSGEAKYDGEEHTVTGYDVAISNPLYTEADFTFSGDATVKGTDAGTYEMTLTADDFTNISENFSNVEFVIVDGDLEISKRVVTLTSATDSKVYDGTALTNSTVTVTGDGFVEGEGAAYNVTGTQTTIGTSNNSFTYTLNEGTKAANYDITVVIGTLTVTELTEEVVVTITEHSGAFEYDGTEKKVEGYDVQISNPLYTVNDFTFSGNAVVTGTTVGTYPMQLTAEDFTNTNENFANVKFVIVDGALTITAMDDEVVVTITENSGAFEYDGEEKKVEGYVVTSISNELYTVNDFTFSGNAVVTGTTVGTYPMELKPADFTNTNENFANVTFVIVDGALTITAMDDEVVVTITENSGAFEYDGEEKKVEGYVVTSISNELYTVDDFTFSGSAVVTGTTVGTYPMQLTAEDFANINENFANVKFVIVDGALTITAMDDEVVVTITENSGAFEYDGEEKKVEGYEVTSISNELYTVNDFTFSGNAVVTGTTVGTYPMQLTAEDFANTNENFANVKFVIVDGALTITAMDDEVVVTITEHNGSYTYDGAEKTVEGYDVSISNPLYTVNDFTFDGNDSVSATYVGTYPMELEPADFANVNPNFANVTFVIVDGELVITPIETVITITADSNSKIYDGAALTDAGYTFTENVLVEGDELIAVVEGTITNVGTAANVVTSYKVMRGEVDVTANYTFGESVDGTLTITKREVTLTSADDEKVYDGIALTNDTVTAVGFVAGEGASYNVTGSQLYVGSSDNEFTYTLNENTLAGNYDITVVFGTLTVTIPTDHSFVITKTHDETKTYDLGDVVEFTIVATNVYAEAKTITISEIEDVVITGESVFENVQPGESVTTTAEWIVTEEAILAGEFTNTAAATIDEDVYTADDTVNPAAPNPSLNVVKTTTSTPAEGDDYALGETITYKIVVTNDGNLTITNVVVTDELTGDEWTVESMAPGAVVEYTAEYVVTEADILAGSVVNVATADGDNPSDDPTDPGEDEEEDPTDEPNPSLNVVKTTTSTPANGETYALGETITYKIVVTNDGNLTITNVVVTDELTGDEWTVESMAPGAVVEYTAEYVVTEADILAGSVVNVATADGDNPSDEPTDPGEDEEEDETDEPNPSLNVVKTTTSTPANGETYALGETITYKIVVTNDGNLTITNVVVTDELTGDEWTVESMAPGAEVEYTAEYVVTEADILAGSVVNVATADGDNPSDEPTDPGEDEEEDETDDPNPSLNVVKTTTSTPANGETYALGETITYKIVVTNDGNLTITDVVVTDELTGDIWTVESMVPGASVEYTAEYVVTEADILAGSVVNVATADGDNSSDVPTDPGEDEEEDETDDPNPSLNVVKTTTSTPANGETYALGETITYKIVVTNDGNLTITNVVVTDELTGDEWTVESMAPGASVEYTAEYVVTEADILAGSVVNVATADGDNPSDDPTDPGEDEEEDETDDINVEMIVTKESDADETTGLGDTITYTITVTNAGNVPFTNVVVDDQLEGAVIVPAETFTIDENGNAVFAEIAVGETVELTATYVVTEADLAVEEGAEVEAEITNVVTATGDEIDNPKDEEPETFIPSGEASVTDEIVPYTVTVNYWYYWYDVVDTEVAAPSVVEQHFNGETYQIVSPVIEGYTASIEVVEGVMDGDIVIDVIYHRIRQHLTIYYVYEDGTTAAATYDKRIGVGNEYSVTSPYIPGFTASMQVVSGVMPNHDLVYTVIYVPDVYEVPMNIGYVTMNVGDCFE